MDDIKLFFNKAFDLTIPFDASVEIKNIKKFTFRSEKLELRGRTSTSFQCNIHSLTHFDLPDTYLPSAWKRAEKYDINRKTETLDRFLKPLICDVLFIDISHKKEGLKNLLLESKENFSEIGTSLYEKINEIFSEEHDYFRPLEFIDECITTEDYIKLISDLCICKKEIENPINEFLVKNPNKEIFIIFYTGWSEFIPKTSSDLNHPIFEAWHPYLLNPFLDNTCTDFLVYNKNIIGIGVDTLNLECPLKFVNERGALKFVAEAKKYFLRRQENILVDLDESLCLSHMKFLAEGKYYLKHLGIEEETYEKIKKYDKENKGWLSGTMILLPIILSDEIKDSVLVKVFFKP